MTDIPRDLQNLYAAVRVAEQKYGRPAGSVRILAVSKTRSTDDILAAYQAGQRHFAENYLQEAGKKIAALHCPDLSWHLIGPVQSNKTKGIAESFSWVHSLDRLKIARRLHDGRPGTLPKLNVCIQVNISGEATKAGIAPADLEGMVKEVSALSRLNLRGLMAMPLPEDDFNRQREAFRYLRSLFTGLNDEGYKLDTLSMGTSNDWEAAIAEGATIIRIGTAIFGPRDY